MGQVWRGCRKSWVSQLTTGTFVVPAARLKLTAGVDDDKLPRETNQPAPMACCRRAGRPAAPAGRDGRRRGGCCGPRQVSCRVRACGSCCGRGRALARCDLLGPDLRVEGERDGG